MQRAPGDKGPPRSVPEPTEEEGDQDVAQLDDQAATASTEWEIDVFAQEPGEAHVPAAPKVGDVHRLIRRVEVGGELDREDSRQPDGHVRVAREVEVDLERIRESPRPRCEEWERRASRGLPVDGIGIDGEGSASSVFL